MLRSIVMMATYILALFVSAGAMRTKEKLAVASSGAIKCDQTKKQSGPLKWGADFDSIPLGADAEGNEKFMGGDEDAKKSLTLGKICCGDEDVEAKWGHGAAEGHWFYKAGLSGYEEEVADALSNGNSITFRCSFCGAILFVLNEKPRNELGFEEGFDVESGHHGWPSFRDMDVYLDENNLPNLDSYDLPEKGFGGAAYPTEKRRLAVRSKIAEFANVSSSWAEYKLEKDAKGLHRMIQGQSFEVHCSNCGAHVGHNIPDAQGRNRYCIDAGCVAGAKNAPANKAAALVEEPAVAAGKVAADKAAAPKADAVKVAADNSAWRRHWAGMIGAVVAVLGLMVAASVWYAGM